MQYYETIDGVKVPLDLFDDEESGLLRRMQRYAARNPDWNDFSNRYWEWLTACYSPRGLSAAEIVDQPMYLIAEDLEAHLGIAQGKTREPDYRDELQRVIEESGTTRYQLAKKTNISQAQLSHVLKGRKNLSLSRLTMLLDALGHRITFVPKAASRSPILARHSPGNAAVRKRRSRPNHARHRDRAKRKSA